jgi:hypothetical protein
MKKLLAAVLFVSIAAEVAISMPWLVTDRFDQSQWLNHPEYRTAVNLYSSTYVLDKDRTPDSAVNTESLHFTTLSGISRFSSSILEDVYEDESAYFHSTDPAGLLTTA